MAVIIISAPEHCEEEVKPCVEDIRHRVWHSAGRERLREVGTARSAGLLSHMKELGIQASVSNEAL